MLTPLLALTGLLVVDASASPLVSRNNDKACSGLFDEAPKYLSNLTVNLAEYVAAGSTINETLKAPAAPVATDLPEFCRFSANITTSATTSVRFEVWMPPKDSWNGNSMFIGNGGVHGYTDYSSISTTVGKYKFAVAATNTGHDGDSGDGSFALNSPESQIDFGYRAVHLSTQYSKKIIELYYGEKAKLSYWNGCSSGGKQGLKSIQMFPEDFDAALVGAPAWDWSHLNGWTYYVNAIVNGPNTTGFIPPSAWVPIHVEVLSQCDGLDGLVDGVITEPGKCFLDYSKFGCNGNSTAFNSTTCLNSAQLETLPKIFTNWTNPATGELLFPAFNIGAEYAFGGTVNGIPYGPAPNYFLYQVLNQTKLVTPVDTPALTFANNGSAPTESQLINLVNIGQRTDPGMIIANDYDLSPYFNRGGKLIHYVGGGDVLIPTNTSHVYYENVIKTIGQNAVDKSYRFYEVPGMGHCRGGPGAPNFGQASQAPLNTGGSGQSSVFDKQHDALLALRAWREEGEKPGVLIGAGYIGMDKRNGTALTRPICPWPKFPQYKGGNSNSSTSFECE